MRLVGDLGRIGSEGADVRDARWIPRNWSAPTAILVDDEDEWTICPYNGLALSDDPTLPLTKIWAVGQFEIPHPIVGK